MAQNLNASSFSSSSNTNFGNKEKAAAWLNFSLPGMKGNTKAVGGIPLRLSNANERQLIEYLRDPKNLEKLKETLLVKFQEVDDSEEGGYKLP